MSGSNDDKASSDKWRMPAIVFNSSVKKCIRYMCDVQGKGGPCFNDEKIDLRGAKRVSALFYRTFSTLTQTQVQQKWL